MKIKQIAACLLFLIIITACNNAVEDESPVLSQTPVYTPDTNPYTPEDDYTDANEAAPLYHPPAASDAIDTAPLHQLPAALVALTFEEKTTNIVTIGHFWEDWWMMRGPFAWGVHIEDADCLCWHEHGGHPQANGYRRLLPSSGFTNMDDIEDFLTQFYTDAWVYAMLINPNNAWCDNQIALSWFTTHERIFWQHEGELFVPTWGTLGGNTNRPDWSAATHTLIAEEPNRTVIETTVPVQSWATTFARWQRPTEAVVHFVFVDGKIDEMLLVGNLYEALSTPVLNDMAVSAADMSLLALALHDFLSDAESGPEWLEDAAHKHALLVDIDGYGTPGVLASKWTSANADERHPANRYLFIQTLFFVYDGHVNDYQIGWNEFIPMAPNRRLVQLSGGDTCGQFGRSYALMGIQDGTLTTVKTLSMFGMHHSRNLPHMPDAYVFSVDNNEITLEQFMAYANYYGITNIIQSHFQRTDLACEIDLILSALE